MLEAAIVAGILICAFFAIRASRLLVSALWLAGTSALVALMMYMLGAPEIAVIELSVGAGLVTVLFVFAINLTGEEEVRWPAPLPKPLAWAMVLIPAVLLGWMVLPNVQSSLPALMRGDFQAVLWEARSLDILLQVVLIFSGVLGVLGLISDTEPAGEAIEEEGA
ncbi:MAG TPA: DUF4040 domain-containing protein [Chloroflexi bacterium]|jgi:uncharacterized MnhB-related membrane protein|nr:DUF4040 domain-containing protein [Chloroflexota bacterium]HPO59652.1 NADH-quinone oxidoreductase subunit J [Anaerolineaceae bacterium]